MNGEHLYCDDEKFVCYDDFVSWAMGVYEEYYTVDLTIANRVIAVDLAEADKPK